METTRRSPNYVITTKASSTQGNRVNSPYLSIGAVITLLIVILTAGCVSAQQECPPTVKQELEQRGRVVLWCKE